jgi:hypothetical protein
MKTKGQTEFVWIFSLIIGAMILFLAIYASSKVLKTGTYQTEAEIVRSFDIILNPFSAIGSIASLTLSKEINMPYETEMNFTCSGNSEKISLRQVEKNNKGEWTTPYTIKNKYIFSEQIIRGKKFSAFSKPFKLPWRIDDMIYLISKNYCFINPPTKIENELNSINATQVKVAVSSGQCGPGTNVRVCFAPNFDECSSSDARVSYYSNYLEKNGIKSFFLDDASLYASIFSDKQTYDCNMKRLLNRLSIQTSIIMEQANILKGCVYDSLRSDLESFKTDIDSIVSIDNTATNLITDSNKIKNLDNPNCPIINR